MPAIMTKSALSVRKMIPVSDTQLGEREKELLCECIDTGWISSEGPFVKKFEREFAAKVGRKYGVAVCNGSAALDAAVAALGVGKGDEVILPTFTIISCASAIIRSGAKPVLVDSDPDTWNMDVSQIECKITENTRAIMAVHLYGLPVDMAPILALAEKYDLRVIEDAAEMIGQEYYGQPCGGLGDISIVSFYPNKHITTGEGGMILTDNERLADRCRSLRNLCFWPEQRFVHEELGWNFRMTNLQAAIGLAQIERLDDTIAKKRQIGQRYTHFLGDIKNLQLPVPQAVYADNIYWVYGLVIGDKSTFGSNDAILRLRDKQIGARPFFWPMHQQPIFKRMGLFRHESYPIAEQLARKGFYIPSGLSLTDLDVQYVSQILHEVFG